jgi:hypothetical protein
MSRQRDTPDLKTLQKIWYKKLKNTGFVDIEDTNSPKEFLKTWHSSYFISRYTPETFERKEAYYRLCSHFLWDYEFESNLEREIWRLHSEGMSLRDIAQSLRSKRIKLNKDNVNKIIIKLIKIMRTSQSEGHEAT